MQYLKIGAQTIPPGLTSRSQWAVNLLKLSLTQRLEPVPVPEALVSHFTVGMPNELAEALRTASAASGHTVAMTAAMLIAAAQLSSTAVAQPAASGSPSNLVGEHAVRNVLKPLLHHAWKGLCNGKIVFAEASTGTGKGRLVASLAASSASEGKTTLVTAPLPVLYQLVTELRTIQTEIKPLLLLGRANFVNPERLEATLDEDSPPALREWIENGGLPHTRELKSLSESLQVPLRWLAEDVLAFDESLNVGELLLDDTASEDNPAELAYRAAFEKLAVLRDEGGPCVLMCSHLMLAVDSKLKTLHKGDSGGLLPSPIDALVVDEAHLLEHAFASVHSNTIHLSTLERRIRDAAFPSTVCRELVGAANTLMEALAQMTEGKTVSGTLDNFPLLVEPLASLADLVRQALGKRKRSELSPQAATARRAMEYVLHTLNSALSGYAFLQLGTTPVRGLPLLTCGRNNLDSYFEKLWKQVGGCVLTSATLYAPDATGLQTAAHLRWVLGIPKNRASYPTPVIPAWVHSTATLHKLAGSSKPDDSEGWLDQTAEQLDHIYLNAVGGTLALCTSYSTVEALTKRLKEKHPHLVAQSVFNSASRCGRIFRQQAASGIKPLWLGVGAAWTGIDLADKSVPADKDKLLTDLYIPRIPYGCNRTLTHQRRREALGFMVEVHETARMLKQGLGRLVRREGLCNRHIWLADIRIQYPTPSLQPLLKLLAAYKTPES